MSQQMFNESALELLKELGGVRGLPNRQLGIQFDISAATAFLLKEMEATAKQEAKLELVYSALTKARNAKNLKTCDLNLTDTSSINAFVDFIIQKLEAYGDGSIVICGPYIWTVLNRHDNYEIHEEQSASSFSSLHLNLFGKLISETTKYNVFVDSTVSETQPLIVAGPEWLHFEYVNGVGRRERNINDDVKHISFVHDIHTFVDEHQITLVQANPTGPLVGV